MTKPYYPVRTIDAPNFLMMLPPGTDIENAVALGLAQYSRATLNLVCMQGWLRDATGPDAGAWFEKFRRRVPSDDPPAPPELLAAAEAGDLKAVRYLFARWYLENVETWKQHYWHMHGLINKGLARLRKRRHRQPYKDQYDALHMLRAVFRDIGAMDSEGEGVPEYLTEAEIDGANRKRKPRTLEDIARALVAESSPPGGEPEPPPPPPAAA